MPYTNTQHPSNTRTTVTIVLSIIFGVSIIPTTALGALYFTLENSDVPTLYQEVKIKIRRGSTDKDPVVIFKTTDKFYFIEKAESGTGKGSCVAAPSSAELINGQTLRDVIEVGVDGSFALATVIIKNPEFVQERRMRFVMFSRILQVVLV